MGKHGVLLIIIVFCFFSHVISAMSVPSDLLILTEDYAPLNYEEDGNLKGISVDIVDAVMKDLGSGINRDSFRLVPWIEGFETAQKRNNTLLFSTARLPEREDLFLWAGPLISDLNVLYGIPGDETMYISPDIKSLKIAAIKNDSGLQLAIDAGADSDQIIEVSSPQEAIMLVENGSANAWSYGEKAGRSYIDRYATNPEIFAPIMDIGNIDGYLAFNKNTSRDFVTAVNESLWRLKHNMSDTGVSEYDRIIYRYLPAQCAKNSIDEQKVTDLVNLTCQEIEKDAEGTFQNINSALPPYKDQENPGLYVFVYTPDVVLVADAENPLIVGKNMSGKVDVTGKPFRDELVAGALEKGSGYVQYLFANPGQNGIFPKKSYYRLVTGSDRKKYIVASGRYLTCAYLWSTRNSSQDRNIEMEIQPDGKIILCGTVNTSNQKDIQIIRYLPDGRRDQTFCDNGSIRYAGSAGKDDYAFGITLDPEGKVVVAGREHNGHDPDILLLRYNQNGTPDLTFGNGGKVLYAGQGKGTDSARGVVMQSDGRILITGEINISSHKEMISLRYNPEGTLDKSYGNSGVFILNMSDNNDSYGFGLVLDKEEKAVITGGGSEGMMEKSGIATVRVLENGSIDRSFGSAGMVIYQGKAGGPDYGNWVTLSPDGKILVTGAETDAEGSYDIVLIRYNPDGSLDQDFGDDGVVRYGAKGYDYAWGQTVTDDGKIIIAGTTELNGIGFPVLISYNNDGTPDETFGLNGAETFEAFGPGLLYAVKVNHSKEILANGYITKDGKDIALFLQIPI